MAEVIKQACFRKRRSPNPQKWQEGDLRASQLSPRGGLRLLNGDESYVTKLQTTLYTLCRTPVRCVKHAHAQCYNVYGYICVGMGHTIKWWSVYKKRIQLYSCMYHDTPQEKSSNNSCNARTQHLSQDLPPRVVGSELNRFERAIIATETCTESVFGVLDRSSRF